MRLTYQELEAGQGKTSDNADVVDVRLLKLVEGKRWVVSLGGPDCEERP